MQSRVASGSRDRHGWALLLAAGEGRRLSSLTTTASGATIPKQYCSLWGGKSLLRETLLRAEHVVPRRRICAVVAARHRQWWEPSMWSLPAGNTIVQPDNRGTCVGVLLPLMHILRRDPLAHVLVLPCDHHVRDNDLLVQAMQRALAYSRFHEDSVVLLGFRPAEPDPELGYIVPHRPPADGLTFQVSQFVEKPAPAQALELIARQALWNGFIIAASARALLALYQIRYAKIVDALRQVAEGDAADPVSAACASAAYDHLPLLDFSRDLLQGNEARMRVLPVPDCGWTDLGTPSSVLRVVRRDARLPGAERNPWGAPTMSLAARSLAATHESPTDAGAQ